MVVSLWLRFLAHLVCFADVLKIYFSDFCQTSYLNIPNGLHAICRFGRALAVDEDPKFFFNPLRYVAMTTDFC